eukprot:scaffold137455_cov24-Tisochrysis_lutea.AAC.2
MDCPACWVSLPPAACANSAAAASNTSCTAAGNRCGATQAMGCPSLAHLFGPLGLQQHAQTARQPLHARYVKQQAAGTASQALHRPPHICCCLRVQHRCKGRCGSGRGCFGSDRGCCGRT